MGGRAVEVEVIFLHVLAVIALVAGQAEQALLQNGVAFVPQGQGKTDGLLAVADSRQTVFIPAIGARAGVIVRQVFPGVAVRAVVFADRAPGALAEVGPPALPVLLCAPRIPPAAFLPASSRAPPVFTQTALADQIWLINALDNARRTSNLLLFLNLDRI